MQCRGRCPADRYLESDLGIDIPGLDRLAESGVVALVLVGVCLGEVASARSKVA